MRTTKTRVRAIEGSRPLRPDPGWPPWSSSTSRPLRRSSAPSTTGGQPAPSRLDASQRLGHLSAPAARLLPSAVLRGRRTADSARLLGWPRRPSALNDPKKDPHEPAHRDRRRRRSAYLPTAGTRPPTTVSTATRMSSYRIPTCCTAAAKVAYARPASSSQRLTAHARRAVDLDPPGQKAGRSNPSERADCLNCSGPQSVVS